MPPRHLSLGDLALDAEDLNGGRRPLPRVPRDRCPLAAAKQRRRDFAVRLWGGVYALEQAAGMLVMEPERSRYERLLHELESASDTSAAFERGKVLTLDEAVQYALASE